MCQNYYFYNFLHRCLICTNIVTYDEACERMWIVFVLKKLYWNYIE